jgi:hypothetical protein
MTKLTVWQTLIIAVVPAIITIINSWALKLFEIRQNNTVPKKEPNAASGAHDKKTRLFNFFELLVSCALIEWCVFGIIWWIQFPSPNQNVDALFISLDVVVIWSNLRTIFRDRFIENRFKRISDRFDMISEHTDLITRILKQQSDMAKGQSEIDELHSKKLSDLQKLLEKRKKKSSQNKSE